MIHWAGYYVDDMRYEKGAVTVLYRRAFIALENCINEMPGPSELWVDIGKVEPHPIDHPWIPEVVEFPFETGDPAVMCKECWHTHNFINSFKPQAHEYIIQELP